MNKTNIEWVKNPDGTQGYTWNPITGCLNGCPYCYARKLANGPYLIKLYLAGGIVLNDGGVDHEGLLDPFYPRYWDDKCYEIVPQGKDRIKPRGVFVCDMSDLFGIGIPERWTSDVLHSIRCRPDWRFYLLTKQPQNLIKWSPFPDNCWVGVSVTNQDDVDKRLPELCKVEAYIRFVSVEPMLGKVNLKPYLPGWNPAGTTFENPEGVERYDIDGSMVNPVDWVIIGAETPYNPRTAPKIEDVKEIVEAADCAGVKVFLKHNLRPVFEKNDDYGLGLPGFAMSTETGMLRQEMPE